MKDKTLAVSKILSKGKTRVRKPKPPPPNPEIDNYNPEESNYYNDLEPEKQEAITRNEIRIGSILELATPLRFKILLSNIDEKLKSIAIQKLNNLCCMDPGGSEYLKALSWIQSVCRIPFNVYKPLPVDFNSPKSDIQDFLKKAKDNFDNTIYGHTVAKEHIIRLLAQWISNPNSKGMAIGIQGGPGQGKTDLVKECICKILGLPFAFIPLGGAGDGSYLDGHSYTYEGATWGKVVDVLMKSKCMNPVFFFDELDKVSDSYHGEEIIGKLIHLTDITQNDKVSDRYFTDFDFDLSRCLFIFAYNEEENINPVLRDRMVKIRTNGYMVQDKIQIAQKFMIERILKEYNMVKNDIVFSDDIIQYIIQKIDDEGGVRNMRRALIDVVSNINLNRLLSDTNYMEFPYTVKIVDVDKYVHNVKDDKCANMMYI